MKQALPWIAVVAVVLVMLDVGAPRGEAPLDPDDPALQILGDPGLQVVEMHEADVPSDCPDPTACESDYLAFLEKVAAHRGVGDAGSLLAQLATLDPEADLPAPDDLVGALIRDTGLTPLLDGLDERELLVVERSNEAGSGIQQIRLGFEDPFVGVVEALFLMPGTPPPWAGLVVQPPRGGSLADGRDAVDGVRLASAGVAVLVIQPRIDGGDALESELSLGFLTAGVPLAGARIYELLLARKYLRWRIDVLPDRLALVVGIGGAEVGEVAARLADWAAYVGPDGADWLALTADGRPTGATVPGLVGLRAQLAGQAGLPSRLRRHPAGEPTPPADLAAFIRASILPPPLVDSDPNPGPAVGADLRQPEAEHADP
jgi:hypothetical protein